MFKTCIVVADKYNIVALTNIQKNIISGRLGLNVSPIGGSGLLHPAALKYPDCDGNPGRVSKKNWNSFFTVHS